MNAWENDPDDDLDVFVPSMDDSRIAAIRGHFVTVTPASCPPSVDVAPVTGTTGGSTASASPVVPNHDDWTPPHGIARPAFSESP